MEIRRLRYFVRVAEDGSLTRSASILRIAQSALTRQMRLLEEELGVKLFVRSSRGMSLTTHGEQLRASVASPLRELELALDTIRSPNDSRASAVVIGLTPGLTEAIALDLAAELDKLAPNAAIKLIEGPSGSLVDWLNRGVVDVALLEDAARDDRVEERLIHRDALWLIGPADDTLGDTIPFAEVALRRLILPSHHLGIRAAIDDAFAAAGLTPTIRMHVDSPRLTCALVSKGKGHAILPIGYCTAGLKDGQLTGCPITGPSLDIGIHLAFRRHRRSEGGTFDRVQEIVGTFAKRMLDRR